MSVGERPSIIFREFIFMTSFIHFILPFHGTYKDLKCHISLYLHFLSYYLGYELV